MTKPKAKRVLKNIDFSKEDAHIALVGPAVGGPANGADYALVVKATQANPEFIKKMQGVKVTLDTPEFLERFFHLYGTDAEVLARLMGYVPEAEDPKEDAAEAAMTWEEYIENEVQEKLAKFEIIKSVEGKKNPSDILNILGEDNYVKLLKFQSKFEKALMVVDRLKKSTDVTPVTEAATSTETNLVENTEVGANPASEQLEKSMDENKVEMIEKSAFESLQVELQKAKDAVAAFEAEKAQAVAKARKAALVSAVKDEAKAEVLFKSLVAASDSEFDAVVKTLSEMQTSIEKSSLFEEKGAAVDTQEPVKESGVMKALKTQKIVK